MTRRLSVKKTERKMKLKSILTTKMIKMMLRIRSKHWLDREEGLTKLEQQS